MRKNIKLSNGIFIFETKKDLLNFWDNVIGKNLKDSVIDSNMFIVIKRTWLSKLIQWIVTKL